LARLSARFSLRVLLDFLLIDCRGDLSDILDPLIWGLAGPGSPIVRLPAAPMAVPTHVRRTLGVALMLNRFAVNGDPRV
jgi:hypothetical protein